MRVIIITIFSLVFILTVGCGGFPSNDDDKKNPKYFTVNASVSSEDGTIYPSGISKVEEGSSLSFFIDLRPGYKCDSVSVNNELFPVVNHILFKLEQIDTSYTVVAIIRQKVGNEN